MAYMAGWKEVFLVPRIFEGSGAYTGILMYRVVYSSLH